MKHLENEHSGVKTKTLFIFMAYVWTKTLLGLTIRPYKSVREITRKTILLPVVLSPLIGLAILFILGRMGSYVFEVEGLKKTVLAIVLSTSLLSILLWQGLLLYLLLSFYFGLRKK